MFSPTDRSSSLIFYPFDEYTSQIFIFAQDAVTNERIGIRIARTRGIADGFKTLAYTRPNVEIPPGMLVIIIDIRCGNLVKTFSVTATIAIWLITLMLLLVMLTCVFFGFRQRSEVLVIPVATLFAFTQLRQSMPGAPSGFGDVLVPLSVITFCGHNIGSVHSIRSHRKDHCFELGPAIRHISEIVSKTVEKGTCVVNDWGFRIRIGVESMRNVLILRFSTIIALLSMFM